MDNEVNHLIIHCFSCIRCDQNSTFETGLSCSWTYMYNMMMLPTECLRFLNKLRLNKLRTILNYIQRSASSQIQDKYVMRNNIICGNAVLRAKNMRCMWYKIFIIACHWWIPVSSEIDGLITEKLQVTWFISHTILSYHLHCLVNYFPWWLILVEQITAEQNKINLTKTQKTIT
jgi:hypothetical protein